MNSNDNRFENNNNVSNNTSDNTTNQNKHEVLDKEIRYTYTLLILLLLYFIILLALCINKSLLIYNNSRAITEMCVKPILYLYPTEETTISVTLDKPSKLTCSYPKYSDNWVVQANPNGDLVELNSNKNLYALYYECENSYQYKIENEGFVVAGEDTAEFLEEKLSILGLSNREAEEFIVYWLPRLESHKYNYIRFATMEEMNANMELNISPKPDTLIRVMMTFKELDTPIDVQEQHLEKVERTGYVAVEWGGSEIK